LRPKGTAMSRSEAPEFPVQRAATLCATPRTAPIKDCTPLLMAPQTPRCPAIALSGQRPMFPCSQVSKMCGELAAGPVEIHCTKGRIPSGEFIVYAHRQNLLTSLITCLGCHGTNSEVASQEHPRSAHKCMNQLEDLGGERQIKNDMVGLHRLCSLALSALSFSFLFLFFSICQTRAAKLEPKRPAT